MKKLVSLILVAFMLFSLCSCATARNNLQLNMGTLNSVSNLDPLFAYGDAEKMIATNCFEGLLRIDADGKIDLGGATGYSVSQDNLVYTFKLNPSAKWYVSKSTKTILTESAIEDFDTAITADDYIYGIKRFIENGNTQLNAIKGAEEYIESIENKEDAEVDLGLVAVDEHTLQITLSRKDPSFLYSLATLPVYPCDQLFYETLDSLFCSNEATVINNGPYYIERADESEALLKRNPDYNGKVQVKNNSVLLYTTGKRNTLVSRFEEGKYDLYLTPGNSKLKKQKSAQTSIDSTWGFVFNQETPIGKSAEIRDILLSTINFKKLKQPSFSAGKADTIIPENYLIGDNPYSDFEPKKLSYTKDQETAQKNLEVLLARTGKEAYTVALSIPAPMEKTMRKVIENWEITFEEKILFDLRFFDLEDTDKILEEADYDMAILPLKATTKTAFGMLDALSGAPCYCTDKKLVALTSNLKTTNEENALICGKIEKYLVDNGIFVPLFYGSNELYFNKGVKDIYLADGGNLIYFHAGTKPESK